jgi:simple sugar transport system ATP-binding protein
MVHQHFKLVHPFTVLENIVLGCETTRYGVMRTNEAHKKVMELSAAYGLEINPDAKIADITVGMQQRTEILKMLYRDNEILIFDEPTAVLTPQEITELMKIMRNLASQGKSILFITHKLNEIKAVADRCTVLRKGRYIGTVDVASATKEELSEMMVGRKVILEADKPDKTPGEVILDVRGLTLRSRETHKNIVDNVSFKIREGEIVCIAGIDGNGQSELVYALTALMKADGGTVIIDGNDVSSKNVRKRGLAGMTHIPEDRHKHGLILDFNLAYNLALQRYFEPHFSSKGFMKYKEIYRHSDELIEMFDIRCGQGSKTGVRSMSGGNQQKAIIAREVDRGGRVLVAVQPTRGLDVGAIEYIHSRLIEERNKGKAILLVSLELDEVLGVSDRILVIYEGRIVADVNPKETSAQQLGLYMAGSKQKLEVRGQKLDGGAAS